VDITGYLTDGKGNWWEWVKIEDPEKIAQLEQNKYSEKVAKPKKIIIVIVPTGLKYISREIIPIINDISEAITIADLDTYEKTSTSI
jgi:hypothetical protein